MIRGITDILISSTATLQMASFQIVALEYFNFSRPEEWPRWTWKFECFSQASGLHSTDTGTLRRNRRHLNPLPHATVSAETEQPSSGELNRPQSNATVTRSGRVSKPPSRLLEDSYWNSD